jgi:DNA-directed RNA polymerase subunit RPC12/RpoP
VSRATPAPVPPTATPALTREGRVSLSKKASSLPILSRYRIAYYCSRCVRWLLHEQAVLDRMGRPRCPRCGSLLRTKPWRGGGK